MSDVVFEPTPGYHPARRFLRPGHEISFRTIIGSADEQVDLWDLAEAEDFPLFKTPGTLVVTSAGGVDDGKTVTAQGLGSAGVFQSEDVIVGDPATPTVWRSPLAQIRLDGTGQSGVKTGAVGDITATVGGFVSGLILAGQVRSHSGIREVPANERWVVKLIGASLVVDVVTGGGKTGSVVSGRLVSAFPDRLVEPQPAFRISSSFVAASTSRFYDPGSYFYLEAVTDTPDVLVVVRFQISDMAARHNRS